MLSVPLPLITLHAAPGLGARPRPLRPCLRWWGDPGCGAMGVLQREGEGRDRQGSEGSQRLFREKAHATESSLTRAEGAVLWCHHPPGEGNCKEIARHVLDKLLY